MDVCNRKQYSDACVQTSPNASATRIGDAGTICIRTRSVPSGLKRVTYVDQEASGVYLNDLCPRRIYPRTPVNRMETRLPFNAPNSEFSDSPSIRADAQPRVVSLPEQLDSDAHSRKLANSFIAYPRNVSMPAAIQHFPQANLIYEESSSTHASPSVSYEEELSLLQNYAQTSGLSCTSSLPSTPNSVEIIDSSFHLSDTFLRGQGNPINTIKTVQKDWITWSNSPPRPIPALHGPSSLPYARCPSGAEGTIIEEPSSVPGLIWGLKDSALDFGMEVEFDKPKVHAYTITTQEQARATSNNTHHGNTCSTGLQFHAGTTQILGHGNATYLTKRSEAPPERTREGELLHCEQRNPSRDVIRLGLTKHFASGSVDLVVDSGTDQRLHGQSVNVAVQSQACHVPGSSVRPILREHGQILNTGYLEESALTHSPDFPPEDVQRHEAERAFPGCASVTVTSLQRSDFSAAHNGSFDLHGKNNISQTTLPTPPDSSLPLWPSGPSPLLNDSSLTLRQTSRGRTVQVPVSHLHGLNLHAPAESLESLSDQLRQLVLRQKMGNDAVATLSQSEHHSTAHHPLHEQPISAGPRSFTAPSIVPPRPEMPISLHDLLVRRSREHTPSEVGSAVFPSVIPTSSLNSSFVSEYGKAYSSPANDSRPEMILPRNGGHEYRAGRRDIPSGRRHPRSIPLTRLLERKLAPVPEETSFVSSSPTQIPAATPLPVAAATSIRRIERDYDFTELRSPLEETTPKESGCSKAATLDCSEERKILGPLKQRKRQVKQKVLSDMNDEKVIPSKARKRKSDTNDENVHEPVPTAPTSKRNQTAVNRSTRLGFSNKRGSGVQNPRRKN